MNESDEKLDLQSLVEKEGNVIVSDFFSWIES